MTSFHNNHIFSQEGELSQLTGNYPPERDPGTNEGGANNLNVTESSHRLKESLSSRADEICEENLQINRLVELSLKKLEKKRINLINKEKAIDEEIVKYWETQKRQSEHNLELQMNVEEWSSNYGNELKERNNVVNKLEQVEEFLSKYEQNLNIGTTVGESIEESKHFFEVEFENIEKKSKATRELMIRMQSFVTTELEEKANKCKDLKDTMVKNREVMVGKIQSLASQNEETLNKINQAQQQIVMYSQNKEVLTQNYNSILKDREKLDTSIAKVYQELDHTKTINASRVHNLKLQMNTEENILQNLETKLKEKKESMQSLNTKLTELNNLFNQMREAIDNVEKRVQKKVKEFDLYQNKKLILSDQVKSHLETMKQYKNVENENKNYKDSISTLENDIKMSKDVLSTKENILCELRSELKGLEERWSILNERNFELEREIENTREMENKFIGRMKENKILQQQERQNKIELNESYDFKNMELATEIEVATAKLEEFLSFNESAKKKEKEMRAFIESSKKTVELNEERIWCEQEEQIKAVEKYNEDIKDIKNDLDKYYFFIQEAQIKQKELALILKKKVSLEQNMILLSENHQNKINVLKANHTAQIQEMDKDMEKHWSVMNNIYLDQEQSTEKLKAEIKEEEVVKSKLENELQFLQQKLKKLKNDETMKRNKIAKMEKRQHKIMSEIKITREDIAQAVTGRAQELMDFKKAKLSTPSPSAGLFNGLHDRISKKMDDKENRLTSAVTASKSKQDNTRNWIESMHVDEYDFSEI